tara:strand:+ start:190 stop:408 length:219 start_codon:yes stop_codon:yes gene_type:complete
MSRPSYEIFYETGSSFAMIEWEDGKVLLLDPDISPAFFHFVAHYMACDSEDMEDMFGIGSAYHDAGQWAVVE